MKRTIVFCYLAALLIVSPGCATTAGSGTLSGSAYGSSGPRHGSHTAFSISYVYDDLDDYGYWIDYGPYGWCWTPYDVGPTWRPYMDGYWAYTEFGWTWVSYEPYGWAVYHYGRWIFDPAFGWVWVPGSEWAPAWVAWSYGDPWIGWAPLPPTVVWNVSVGLRWDDRDDIPPPSWCFVEKRHFTDSRLRDRVTPFARNQTLLSRTRNATRYDVRGGRPVNLGPEVANIERSSGHKVRRATIKDVDSPGRARESGLRGGSMAVFRPEIRAEGSREAPPRARRGGNTSVSSAELRTERADRMERLERSLTQERQRLARTQEQELRNRPRGSSSEEIRKRHQRENQELQRHAERQRKVIEERVKKQLVKPEKGKSRDDSRSEKEDNRKGKGRSGSKGGG